MAAEYRARSIMAAPLVVSHDAIGAAVFLHCSDPDFFTPDLAAKATILAGQLGSLLEASRLTQVSREEHRRTKILAEVAQAIHSAPQSAAVVEAVADRLRVLLRTRLVCMMVREGAGFSLSAVAAESSQLAASVRARHDRRGLQFAADLASRAVAAGEPISVAIDPATHALGELVPPGMLIAAPFRTSLTQGAVLIYPRQRGDFQRGGKIADFGGHRFCGGRHRQRGTLQHGPGPGLRTAPVAGYLRRTRIHRPAGRVPAAVRTARGGFPRLWARLHRAARKMAPSTYGGRQKTGRRSRWISCFLPDPPARLYSKRKFSGRTSPAKSLG